MTDIIPVYEKRFEIPSYLADDRAELSVPALFSILQEASNNHATMLGAGWHELRERGFFWVLTRMQLNINRMPKWTEAVTLRSWVRRSDAATSPRDYELFDADGQLLVAGSSVWAILDTTEGRPHRMNMFDGCFLPQERSALDRKPPKIAPLALPETLPDAKTAVYSDIDMNRHVNNAHYILWALDAMDEDFRNTHRITGISVNFIAQAKLGDRYTVCSEPVSETGFKTAILSVADRTEFCRIQTEWMPI